MERYSLWLLFGSMVGIWLLGWAPWRRRDQPEREAPPADDDEPQAQP